MYVKNVNRLIETLEEKKAMHYSSLKNNVGYRLDRSFKSANDNLDLTPEEIKEIDRYWGKYKFAYPEIDYESFRIFKNRLGRFDVRHCPGNVEYGFFFKLFEKSDYAISFQNKAMLPILYSNVKQPRTIIRRMKGILQNENYEPISNAEAINIIKKYLSENENNRIIVKPNGRNGGHGIEFIGPGIVTDENINSVMKKMENRAFVAQ